MLKQNYQPLTAEITVISAEGIKTKSSKLFSYGRHRSFITLTAFQPIDGDKDQHVYGTRVCDKEIMCSKLEWGDKFHIPLATTFFAKGYSIYLQLFNQRPIVGKVELGWCQIPASDVGLPPVASVRYLSYRLRDKDGTRGQGIVNLTVKLEGASSAASYSNSISPTLPPCHTVIGTPVFAFSR